ncbi:hypothetical protein DXG03_000911 [Asterophora parasitica]|uniref:GH16 domain-containing protein n=1 Tax=Asterophora parasitica TaxID=117018 RepID=A0A9P7KAJ8_9AGAR|nr:hypothetical protein DXG03_000911 [Asterophora parasitica]
MKTASAISLLSLAGSVFAATYPLTSNIVGRRFYDAFEFEAIEDPTDGRVNYVDRATAQAQNLTYASGNTFILRTDSTTVLSPDGPGRNSVRIKTKKVYKTHVAVFDIRHIPQGCGTWPAIWETNEADWPNGGETDILEGVNDQGPNTVSLHTGTGCVMPATRLQTGTSLQLNCDANANDNSGCGVTLNTDLSYGPQFNAAGGGWYATERTPNFIKVWFWSRNDPTVPADVKKGCAVTVNTDTWV